jgi:hypothetical protein
MNLREKFAAQSPGAKTLGIVAAICTVFPAIAIAFVVALKTFWWCPQGGCSLATWTDTTRLFGNVSGVSTLMVFFCLALQFPFVLLARPFCSRDTLEEAFFGHSLPLLGWYDRLMRKWIDMLWRGQP